MALMTGDTPQNPGIGGVGSLVALVNREPGRGWEALAHDGCQVFHLPRPAGSSNEGDAQYGRHALANFIVCPWFPAASGASPWVRDRDWNTQRRNRHGARAAAEVHSRCADPAQFAFDGLQRLTGHYGQVLFEVASNATQYQLEERLIAGTRWPAKWEGLVFVTPNGLPLDPANVRRLVKRIAAAAGIEGVVTPYETAHRNLSPLGYRRRPQLGSPPSGKVSTFISPRTQSGPGFWFNWRCRRLSNI